LFGLAVCAHQVKYITIRGNSSQAMPLSAKKINPQVASLRTISRHALYGVHARASFLESRPEQINLADIPIFFVVEKCRARRKFPAPGDTLKPPSLP
jgi:hypothetical protein